MDTAAGTINVNQINSNVRRCVGLPSDMRGETEPDRLNTEGSSISAVDVAAFDWERTHCLSHCVTQLRIHQGLVKTNVL